MKKALIRRFLASPAGFSLSPAGSDRAWLLGATGAQFTPMPFKSFLIRIKKKVPIGAFFFMVAGEGLEPTTSGL